MKWSIRTNGFYGSPCPLHQTLSNQFSFCVILLSLRFNGHFPGEPGLAGVYRSKGYWRWWWQLELQVVQSSSQIITTNKPTFRFFYRLDALPVTQPTVSKHSRENITFHGLAYPKLTWGLPTLSLTTNSSWLPWGRVAMPLISPLMPVHLLCNPANLVFCSLAGFCVILLTNKKQTN